MSVVLGSSGRRRAADRRSPPEHRGTAAAAGKERCRRARRTRAMQHTEHADERIIACRRAPRAAADDTRDDIVERVGDARADTTAYAIRDRAVPGQRARHRREDVESLAQSRRGLVLARRSPSGAARQSTTIRVLRGPKPMNPALTFTGLPGQTERVEIHRRDTDAEREACPLSAQQRPDRPPRISTFTALREHAVNTTCRNRVDVQRVPHRQGLHLRHWGQEIAVMKFLEFDTQPKIAPWALIISSPTR